MSGRYAITLSPQAARAFYGYVEEAEFPPRYNIAPTQPVPIVRLERDRDGALRRHFRLVRWGFIPGWAKEPRQLPLIVNARLENLAEKPSFRAAMMRRRCLFIADGFYEWQAPAGGKGRGPGRPFLVRRTDRRAFGLAGLWEPWLGADGSEIETACIITTAADGTLAAIGERMPALIGEGDFGAWLDVDHVDPLQASALAARGGAGELELVEIGPAINRAANDGPELQVPVAPAAKR
jgi:putative SOS response-associated peptidase YedK